MDILIPNATSPKNVGDRAILAGLLTLLNGNKLKIHSTERGLQKKVLSQPISPTLYSWAVFENKSLIKRITRTTKLLISYLSFRYLGVEFFREKELNSLITDYKNADVIVFVGGGYLRSQKGITQTLNLLMTLLLFQFAKATKSKKIITPISFGPFAYKWQESYAARILNGFDVVATREQYSYDLLKKYKTKNLIRSYDTSFFLKQAKYKKKNSKRLTLGFTIRKWLREDLQKKFEEEFVNAIADFAKIVDAKIQPIVQVDAPDYGDFDAKLTKEIANKLKKNGVDVNSTKKVKDLKDSAKVYGKIDLLLGMRMHSNILAALQGTPFVAISYEYKTKGISKDLGVEDYCLEIEKVNEDNLFDLLMKTYENQVYLKKTIGKSLKKIHKEETIRWSKIFQKYLE